MPSPRDLVLALATASYTVREIPDAPRAKPVTKATAVKVVPIKATVKAEPSLAETSAPNVQREGSNEGPGGLPTMLLPGTYDARRFMAAWRQARTLADKKVALSGYKGYDNRLSFAEQETMSLFHVKRETAGITAGPDRAAIRSAQHTALGFVAGMPDNESKLIQDLLGRERLAVSTMADWQSLLQDESKSALERAKASAQIDFESERLRDIRRMLAEQGVNTAGQAPEHADIVSVFYEVE